MYLLIIPLFNNIPVDNLPHCGKMVRTTVLVVEVIGMFPYIEVAFNAYRMNAMVIRENLFPHYLKSEETRVG